MTSKDRRSRMSTSKLRAEIETATARRPDWRLLAQGLYGSVEATYVVGPWHGTVIGNSRGWFWSLWRDGSPVRVMPGPEGPAESTANKAVAMLMAEVARVAS